MKKGLSVLLIAAALFGFYGGAANIQDVLAAKQYWENKSEQTTADLNKLEDGLKTLDENKQAYLDGLVKVKEGEEALVKGEQDLAYGEATLAQGEADYAAAPGKLADARRQIAAGENKLANGYADLAKGKKDLKEAMANRAALRNVRAKIADVEKAYSPWLNKFDKLRKSIVDNPDNPSKGVLYDAGAVAVGLVGNESNDGILTAFGLLKAKADEASAGAEKAQAGMNKIVAGAKQNPAFKDKTDEEIIAAIKAGLAGEETKQLYEGAEKQRDDAKALAAQLNGAYNYLNSTYKSDLIKTATSINGKIKNIKKADYQATELRKTNFSSDMSDAEKLLNKLATDETLAQVMQVAAKLDPTMAQKVSGGISQVKQLISASKASKSEYDKNYDELKPNASKGSNIGSKVAAAAKAILSNKDISSKMTAQQREALKPFMSTPSITGLPNVELLYGTMTLGKDKLADGKNSLLDSLRTISGNAAGGVTLYNDGISAGEDKLAAGEAQLAQGEKDLAAGKAKYAQGLADYEAAPAKLEAGRQALEEGRQKLADGRKEFAAGKEKLAEYEDGEQQVRAGLATMMASDRYADLETILERRNGDDNFDAADKSLDIPEGLEAVGTGREYQADTGEVVTSELTGRILGSGLGLGAAAIAVLAAVLSLLKKYKGAAVSAVGTAAAGIAGIIAGNNAGMEMSSIAGSTIGATPMIAAGILAAVAAVFSVVHFTAKKDA